MEAVLELLFEVPFEAAMESRKLKTGVKTTLFCVLGGLIEVLFALLTVSSWQDNDYTARFFYDDHYRSMVPVCDLRCHPWSQTQVEKLNQNRQHDAAGFLRPAVFLYCRAHSLFQE